jgi:hypothetical protein
MGTPLVSGNAGRQVRYFCELPNVEFAALKLVGD